MTDPLRRVLQIDERDPGCVAGIPILDHYVDIELAGDDPAHTYPGTAAHLRSCDGCRRDHDGLLELARRFAEAAPPA
jgi:hypothetical protein